MSLNKATLIGNLGKDPEIKTLKNGKEIALFSVATTEGWKDKSTNEWKNVSEWHSIVVFGEGIINYIKKNLKKGTKVYIEGKIKTDKFDKNGVPTYSTKIELNGFNSRILLLDSKQSTQDQGQSNHSIAKANGFQSQNVVDNIDAIDDEIPF